MRYVLVIILLTFIDSTSWAQSAGSKSNYEITFESLGATITQFTEMRMNFVNPRVEDFLSSQMELTMAGEPSYDVKSESEILISSTFHKKIAINEGEKTLTVTYVTMNKGDDLYIRSCQIDGDYGLVVLFFIKFWPTSLNFEDVKKQELVTSNFYEDRIALTPIAKSNSARIEISR